MYIVTGSAGFIGSNVLADLEAKRLGPLAVVDWFGHDERWRNVAKRSVSAFVLPEALAPFLDEHASQIRAVIHMGAISSTTERDVDRLVRLNTNYSVFLWDWCAKRGVPYIYASSAAVYGDREKDFLDRDDPAAIGALRPLNAYGWSKKAADEVFAMRVATAGAVPPQWVGLRFFNVYGPNEYHKDDMRSVVCKMFDALSAGHDRVRLFKSYRPAIAHGEQRRDFVYVKDVSEAILWFLENPRVSGIFNLGAGTARSFLDIVKALQASLNRPLDVDFVDMPEPLRAKYQYFTESDDSKLRHAGFKRKFHSLEEGVGDYVASYLAREDRYR